MLSVDGLGFRYQRQRWLFRGLSFDVGEGMTTAIVGPSGTGKTTLLAVIDGLLRPSEGHVVRPEGVRAWLLQSPSVLARRTARDNVALARVARGDSWSAALRVADELLDLVGLSGQRTQPGRLLSGGETQRVAVARCLASEPVLVLADEPTASLDRSSAAPVGEALRVIAERGGTVLVATHDLRLAEQCDHVVELEPATV